MSKRFEKRGLMACRSYAFVQVVLLLLCTGCIYIPESGPASKSKLDLIGPSGSGKLVQVGITNRDEVEKHFGLPYRHTEHQRALGFILLRKVGYFHGLSPGPCVIAGPGPNVLEEALWAEFDETGVLRRYQACRPGDRFDWDDFIRSVPDKDDPMPGPWPEYPQ
jgi:hypothetical protein